MNAVHPQNAFDSAQSRRPRGDLGNCLGNIAET